MTTMLTLTRPGNAVGANARPGTARKQPVMPHSTNHKRAARDLQQTTGVTYQQALAQVRAGTRGTPGSPNQPASAGPPAPAYGLASHVEPDAIAAWGARTIIHADMLDYVDFVPDRQGADTGPHATHLLTLINTRCPLPALRLLIAAHRRAGALRFDQAGTVTLYEDPQLTIDADTNGSYGYVYVTAWLRAVEHASFWYPPVPDPQPGMPYWLDVIREVNRALTTADTPALGFSSPEFIHQYRGKDRLIERYPSYEVMFPLRTVDIDTGTVITALTADAQQRLTTAHDRVTGPA